MSEVDKRAVLAVIRGLARAKKLVVPLSVVEEELSKMIEDRGEREQLLFDLGAGMARHIYLIRGRLVILPRELSEEKLQILREIAELYRFKAYDGNDREIEVDDVIHNLIRMWDDPCFGTTNAAKAAYYLAMEYGLGIKEVMNTVRKDPRGYGTIVYSIEDSILVSKAYTPCFCDEEERSNDCCEEGGDCVWWEFVEPNEAQNNANA